MAKFIRTVAHPGGNLPKLSPAAKAGEWAVPGAFAFWDVPPDQLSDNFRHGFYGLESYAWSPLVVIAEISEGELDQLRLQLAMHLIHAHGAPGLGGAYAYVDQEIDQTLSLCAAPIGTLLTVERRLDGDDIHEDYRRVQQAQTDIDHGSVRIWGPESLTANGG